MAYRRAVLSTLQACTRSKRAVFGYPAFRQGKHGAAFIPTLSTGLRSYVHEIADAPDGGNVTHSLPVFLVACCGPKLGHAAPAADLYVSSLFKKSRAYAERRGRWFILSALHGLVEPTAEIEPYDITLKRLPAEKRREWGRRVKDQMVAVGILDCELVALAGADYVKPLIAAGIEVSQPMKSLGIGKQLQWLKQANSHLGECE